MPQFLMHKINYELTRAALLRRYGGEDREGILYISDLSVEPSADGGTTTVRREFLKVIPRGEGAEIHPVVTDDPCVNKFIDTLSRQFLNEYDKLGMQ